MVSQVNGVQTDYVIITPVKDEERYIDATLRSVTCQTVLPARWIIVDDSSSDSTPEKLHKYAAKFPWITILRLDRNGERDLGVTEIQAFSEGYGLLWGMRYDFIVKLDGDVELPTSYFQELLKRFVDEPRLGIASGAYLEEKNGEWKKVVSPRYHACGASKMIREECFREIGGFILSRGWDTVDEIRAQIRGWKTAHFPELCFRHLKREGSAVGARGANRFHGEIYYLTGGGLFFFVLKCAYRGLRVRPFVSSGIQMFLGYLDLWAHKRPRAVSTEEARFYRRLLNRRLLGLEH
jgi:glycosyltransferase involved in cell wall biosynthesis